MAGFSLQEAVNKTASPKRIRELVLEGLLAIWDDAERFVAPPGVCGSTQFDHANVVRDLLEWDAEHNEGKIAGFELPQSVIWSHCNAVLGRHFKMHRGRIVGLLEDKNGTSTEKVEDDDE